MDVRVGQRQDPDDKNRIQFAGVVAAEGGLSTLWEPADLAALFEVVAELTGVQPTTASTPTDTLRCLHELRDFFKE
jgi:hypothetical protein